MMMNSCLSSRGRETSTERIASSVAMPPALPILRASPGPSPEARLEQHARVQASKHGHMTARADRKIAQVETAREDFVTA